MFEKRRKTIKLSGQGNIELKEFTSTELFLNRTIAIYGGSASGKTTMIFHIMNQLKHLIPIFLVFSNSELDNGNYKGKVPRALIYDNLTSGTIDTIVTRQEEALKVYNYANDPNVLMMIASKIMPPDLINSIRKANTEIELNMQLDVQKKLRDEFIGKLKVTIQRYFDKLDNPANVLDEKELIAVKYLNSNPNIAIIFDDCTDELNKIAMSKKIDDNSTRTGNALMQILMFRSRHLKITNIIGMHNYTTLLPAMRKSAHEIILCDANNASGFIGDSKLALSKQVVENIRKLSSETFKSGSHKKILVRVEDNNSLAFIEAKPVRNLRVCDESLWSLCDEVTQTNKDLDEYILDKFS